MDTCPTFSKEKKDHMSKSLPQLYHVIKEKGNKCGKVGTTSAKGGHGEN